MASNFGENSMWAAINETVIGRDGVHDLSAFKSGKENARIAAWNMNEGGPRYFKTLLFHEACRLSDTQLAWLDRIKGRDLGAPVTVKVQGRSVCMDYLQAVLELEHMAATLKSVKSVVEIGGGYGRTCHSVISVFDTLERYTIVDLAPCLSLSRQYLSEVLTVEQFNKVRFVANTSLDAEPALLQGDIAINIDSMAEMDADVVKSYLALIDKHCRYFYCKNPLGKYTPDMVGLSAPDPQALALALKAGILTNVVDIFDDQAIAKSVPGYLDAYKPSGDWRVASDAAARPWSYYHQALFARAG